MKTNTSIETFIINSSLIDPVNKIINQLENGEFRDCDIKWLDSKLEVFTEFACKTLGLDIIMPSKIAGEQLKTLNNHVKDQYFKRFNTLLEYFKHLNN